MRKGRIQHVSKPAMACRRASHGVDGVRGGPTVRLRAFVARDRKTVRNGLGGKADFSYWQWYNPANGPIAQLDRVTDFYSVGCRFESCWDRHLFGPQHGRNTAFRILFASGLHALSPQAGAILQALIPGRHGVVLIVVATAAGGVAAQGHLGEMRAPASEAC